MADRDDDTRERQREAQRRYEPKRRLKRAAYLAAGLCAKCGGPRKGPGSTSQLCPRCAERNRANARAYDERRREAARRSPDEARIEAERQARRTRKSAELHARRLAEGRCPLCGTPRGKALAADPLCPRCRADKRQRVDRHRRKKRRGGYHDVFGDGRPAPTGRHVRVGIVRELTISLDIHAQRAVLDLLRRDSQAQLAAVGGDWQKVQWRFRRGRVLRAALRHWERGGVCPTRSPSYRRLCDRQSVHFGVDATCWSIIQRHAEARSGNISATVCDLLVGAAYPPPRAATGRPRKSLLDPNESRWHD